MPENDPVLDFLVGFLMEYGGSVTAAGVTLQESFYTASIYGFGNLAQMGYCEVYADGWRITQKGLDYIKKGAP